MKKSTVLEAEQEKGETGGEEEEIPLAWSSSVSSVRAVQAAAGDLIGTNEGGFQIKRARKRTNGKKGGKQINEARRWSDAAAALSTGRWLQA